MSGVEKRSMKPKKTAVDAFAELRKKGREPLTAELLKKLEEANALIKDDKERALISDQLNFNSPKSYSIGTVDEKLYACFNSEDGGVNRGCTKDCLTGFRHRDVEPCKENVYERTSDGLKKISGVDGSNSALIYVTADDTDEEVYLTDNEVTQLEAEGITSVTLYNLKTKKSKTNTTKAWTEQTTVKTLPEQDNTKKDQGNSSVIILAIIIVVVIIIILAVTLYCFSSSNSHSKTYTNLLNFNTLDSSYTRGISGFCW